MTRPQAGRADWTPPMSAAEAARVVSAGDARRRAELGSVFPLVMVETTPGSGATTLLREWGRETAATETRLIIEADKMAVDGSQLRDAVVWILARRAGADRIDALPAVLRKVGAPVTIAITRADFLPLGAFEELLELVAPHDSVQLIVSGFDLHELMDAARVRRIPFRVVTDEDLALSDDEITARLVLASVTADPATVARLARRTRRLASAVRVAIERTADEQEGDSGSEVALVRPGELGGYLFTEGVQHWPSPLVDFIATMVHVPRFTVGEAAAIGGVRASRVLIDRLCRLDLGRVSFHPALRQQVFTWYEPVRITVLSFLGRRESDDRRAARLRRTVAAAKDSFDMALHVATLIEMGNLADADAYLTDWFWDMLPDGYSAVWAMVVRDGPERFADYPRLALFRLRVEPRVDSPAAERLLRDLARRADSSAQPGASVVKRLAWLAVEAELARMRRLPQQLADIIRRARDLLDGSSEALRVAASAGVVSDLLLIADVCFRLGHLVVAAEFARYAMDAIDAGSARLDPWSERRAFAARLVIAAQRERGLGDELDSDAALAGAQFRWRDADVVAQAVSTAWEALDGGSVVTAERRLAAAQRRLARPEEWPTIWYMRLWFAGLTHQTEVLDGLRTAYQKSLRVVGLTVGQDRTPVALRRLSHVIGGYLQAPPIVVAPAEPLDVGGLPRWRYDELLLDALDRLRAAQLAGARTLLVQAITVTADRQLSPTALVVALPEEVRHLAELIADHPQAELLHLERAAEFAGQVDSVLRLSDREREVLTLLRRGMTNQQIADQLYVSVNTAKYHRGNLMRKLGASTRQELLEAAARLGL